MEKPKSTGSTHTIYTISPIFSSRKILLNLRILVLNHKKKTHKFRIYKQLQILNWAKFSQNFDAHQGIRYPAMAACFAVAHIIVQGRIILVLTFLPGLVLGRLFIRTKLLLAPILFHSMGQAGRMGFGLRCSLSKFTSNQLLTSQFPLANSAILYNISVCKNYSTR